MRKALLLGTSLGGLALAAALVLGRTKPAYAAAPADISSLIDPSENPPAWVRAQITQVVAARDYANGEKLVPTIRSSGYPLTASRLFNAINARAF